MQPQRAHLRNRTPENILQGIEKQVEEKLAEFGKPGRKDQVNQMRYQVAEDCRRNSLSQAYSR